MPLDIQVPSFAGALRALAKLRGKIPLSLDSQLVPVLFAGDATDAPYRLDGKRWAVGVGRAAVAGQFQFAGVRNTGSRIVVVEGGMIYTSAASLVDIGISTNLLAGTTVTSVELEQPTASFPSRSTEVVGAVHSQVASGGTLFGLMGAQVSACTQPFLPSWGVVLPPGIGAECFFKPQTQNLTISTMWWGRAFDP